LPHFLSHVGALEIQPIDAAATQGPATLDSER